MYETLVITTPELLKLFKMFKKGKIKREEIIKHLKEDIGLFKIK